MNDILVIQSKIYEIRGVKVMIDKDLAELYQVTTGNFNKAVKRNIKRFPPDFMFQLTKDEYDFLKFQNGILNEDLKTAKGILRMGRGGVRQLPYAFTVSKWCSNSVQPDLNTLDQIAKLLEVDVKDLLNSTEKISL